jgi:hypothetical protein
VHNEELRGLYFSPNIKEACTAQEEMRNTNKIYFGKLEVKRTLRRLRRR